MRLQEPPNTIQIEPTEGCNRGCSFCGLRGMRKKGTTPHYFMTVETAERIASEIQRVGWNSKVLFAMHGEPTLNPELLRIIEIFRQHLPKAQFSMFTNGKGIADGTFKIKDLKATGINNLMIDLYSEGDDGYKIKDRLDDIHKPYSILGRGVPLYTGTAKDFRIIFAPPIEGTDTLATHHLCNHCGAAFPPDHAFDGKKCTRPFRELSFRYDGSVSLCCNDFRGQYPIGNIMELSIEEIWQHKRFNAARIMLYAGRRSFTPCFGCNAVSMRVGLLPDYMGKETLPEPSEKVEAFCKSISANNEPLCGDNYTQRPWEKEE